MEQVTYHLLSIQDYWMELLSSFLGGGYFYLWGRGLQLEHRDYWIALGVFFGLIAGVLLTPFLYFAKRENLVFFEIQTPQTPLEEPKPAPPDSSSTEA